MSEYPQPPAPPDDQPPIRGPHLREEPVGVYYQSNRPRVEVRDADIYVPRFLSAGFFTFIFGFIRQPGENPVFLREIRRNRRRFGWLSHYPVAFGVVLGVLLTLMAVPAATALGGANHVLVLSVIIPGYFLPGALGGLIAFFMSLSGSQELTNRAMLDELAVTPLRPQEIVFGGLTGGLAPLSLFVAPLVPAYGLITIYASAANPIAFVLSALSGVGMAIWFWPNVFASMLCAAAIASTVSFGQVNYRAALQKSLLTWVAVSVVVFVPIYAGLLNAGHLFFLVGAPVIIIAKLLVAGAFLNHMAWRLAHEQHRES